MMTRSAWGLDAQTAIVLAVVLVSALYATWALMPQALRRAGAQAALKRWPPLARWRWLWRAAQGTGSGCASGGDCAGCGPAGGPAAAPGGAQVIRLHRSKPGSPPV